MRRLLLAAVLIALTAIVVAPAGGHTGRPIAHAAVTCADFPNQAAAQKAHNTIDANHNGIYCEDLPCPCSTAKAGSGGGSSPAPKPTQAGCTTPAGVLTFTFSKAKYPNIRKHVLAAIHDGWPRILVVNRPGASARRDRLLADVPTRHGFDRDEYPPAEARGRGHGLTRGINPTGWMANVRLVPSSENRSQGSVMGDDLRPYCNGTKFREAFH